MTLEREDDAKWHYMFDLCNIILTKEQEDVVHAASSKHHSKEAFESPQNGVITFIKGKKGMY